MTFIDSNNYSSQERDDKRKNPYFYDLHVIGLHEIKDYAPFHDGCYIYLYGGKKIECCNRWSIREKPFLEPIRDQLEKHLEH
jgi:hypothetical protein